jgi:hypothetical protein
MEAITHTYYNGRISLADGLLFSNKNRKTRQIPRARIEPGRT